ncbi:unnamed protein product [Cladocopium goreaui]|uniref:Integrase catalytic domain-containing protein n=1 Tax=Cladocopium goreaui TaxID=2562237 RepID=A0A9P1G796_9DINO|nr:unnamed protein product [Cladocopium goreaui]
MTFTLVGFCTLSHAMYTVQLKPEHLWPQSVFHTFDTLITQGLPKEPPRDMLQLSLLYAGVLFFSIFVMNIFIGVISEQYTKEKEQVAEMFQSLRASSCYTFLLRMCVIPCNLLTKKAAAVVAACSVALTFGLQVASLLFSRQLPGFFQLFAFILCQMVIFMASVQCQGKDYAWEKFSFCSRSELAFSRSYSNLVNGPHFTRIFSQAGSEQSINDALLPVLRQAIREELGGSSRLATYGSSQPPRDLSSGSVPEVTRPPQSTFPNLLRKESRGAPAGTFNLFKRKGLPNTPLERQARRNRRAKHDKHDAQAQTVQPESLGGQRFRSMLPVLAWAPPTGTLRVESATSCCQVAIGRVDALADGIRLGETKESEGLAEVEILVPSRELQADESCNGLNFSSS